MFNVFSFLSSFFVDVFNVFMKQGVYKSLQKKFITAAGKNVYRPTASVIVYCQ